MQVLNIEFVFILNSLIKAPTVFFLDWKKLSHGLALFLRRVLGNVRAIREVRVEPLTGLGRSSLLLRSVSPDAAARPGRALPANACRPAGAGAHLELRAEAVSSAFLVLPRVGHS